MKHLQLWTAAMCSAVALLSSPAANAGVMDFLFGSSSKSETAAPQSTPSASHSRNWQLADFTQIQLVEREKSASDNRHPLNVSPEALRDSLASVRIPGGNAGNNTQPLFAADELAQLSEALAEALASAKPQDDVLLLSTSRRNEGFLSPPKSRYGTHICDRRRLATAGARCPI